MTNNEPETETPKHMWLAQTFTTLGITFEKFNPAAFRFLAAVLPYSTPYPVAWLTMKSAEQFLGFTDKVAFTFVFGLEGMGLWFTSLFVDSVIDVIRSRNTKTIVLVVLFGLVVSAYVSLLVNLNVTLKMSSGESNPSLERVITLLCFLPLLTGVGNGYYKWKLEQAELVETTRKANDKRDETIRKEQNELKLQKAMLKAGMNPLQQFNSDTVSVPSVQVPTQKPRDWRLLSHSDRLRVKNSLTVDEIRKEFPVSKATAYNWKYLDKYAV